jgi:hypothetical protein
MHQQSSRFAKVAPSPPNALRSSSVAVAKFTESSTDSSKHPSPAMGGDQISPKSSMGETTRPQSKLPWLQLIFGIGEELEASMHPGSKLIHPLSAFGITWIAITAMFLGYTALVTPPMIAFHWLDADCAHIPTLPFDCLLDCFFLVDIIITFNTGVITMGAYVDNRWEVTKMYLKSSFLFDCFTSIPVSFFELASAAQCEHVKNSDAAVDGASLRLIRAIKPLRWFKIIRVMKLSKVAPLLTMLMDHWGISPKSIGTIAVMAKLTMIIHLVSCMWWLWKVLGMCPLSDIDTAVGGCAAIEDWLDDRPWGGVDQHTPLDSVEGKVEAYFISVYLVSMTLTTVGFGDITASNTAERVGYALLFVVGAFIWGNLLAQISEIAAAASARQQEVVSKVQSTLEFLVENECPRKLRTEIIQWTRFHEDHYDDNEKKQEMIKSLPRNLQKMLVRHLYSRVVSGVPVFAYIESVDDENAATDQIQETFVNEVFLQFEYNTFTPGDVIVNFSDPADHLVIVVTGKVVVEFEHSDIQHKPITLGEGQVYVSVCL